MLAWILMWRRNRVFTPAFVAHPVMQESASRASQTADHRRRLARARRLLRRRWSRTFAASAGRLRAAAARRGGLALSLVAGLALVGLVERAPPATALIAAPADPTTTLAARTEARLAAQDDALRALSARLASLIEEGNGARAESARQNATLQDLAAAQRTLAQTTGELRDELRTTRDALAQVAADRTAYDAQLSAVLTRITTLADGLTAALDPAASPAPTPVAAPSRAAPAATARTPPR